MASGRAMTTIRPAYGTWPLYNSRFRDVVARMTEEQLAIQPTPERWPLWASVGHMACQRVFWLCDFAGEPDARSSTDGRSTTSRRSSVAPSGASWVHTRAG